MEGRSVVIYPKDFKPIGLADNFSEKPRLNPFRLIQQFYGPQGLKAAIKNLRGLYSQEDWDKIKPELDRYFFENARRILGDEHIFGSAEYIECQKRAVEVVNSAISTLGLPPDQFGFFNEALIYSESPTDSLRMMTAPHINPQLRHQMILRHLLGFVSWQNHLRNESLRSEHLKGVFYYEFMKLLGIDTFNAPYLPLTIYSTHGDKNEVMRIRGEQIDPKNLINGELTIKITKLTARQFNIYGRRFTCVIEMRRKGDSQTVLKALENAAALDDGVNLSPIADLVGFRIVVIEGNIKDLISYFDLNIGRLNLGDFSIVDSKPDDWVGDKRRQHPQLKLKRRQIELRDNRTKKEEKKRPQIEFVFMSLRQYLDHLYHTGKEGDGQAHALYEIRRLLRTAHLLFPPELYGDVTPYIKAKLDATTQNLILLNNVGND
ncbi:MAG: hypothetical protein QHH09_03490 [Microgenomates group bacterium]|nr:hypothetical protein [Microgenomates group bacterium]